MVTEASRHGAAANSPPGRSNTWPDQARRMAREIRRRVLELTLARDGCYLSQALSSAEILATLYTRSARLGPSLGPAVPPAFSGVPGQAGVSHGHGAAYNGPRGSDYDRLLISPAHYAVAVYAALVSSGRMSPEALDQFNTDGSQLEMIGAEHSPGFELTTGSFGQALSQAGGIAMANSLRGSSGRVFVFMSDGELEEGQTWEALQCLGHYRVDSVVVCVDVNGMQYDGATSEVMNIEPIESRITGFGGVAVSVDGHDVEAIDRAIQQTPHEGRPLVILCYTDSAREMPMLAARKPKLHFVRFRNDGERARARAVAENWARTG